MILAWVIIGVSLSKPHTDQLYGGRVCLYIYIYMYRTSYRKSLFAAEKMAAICEPLDYSPREMANVGVHER